MLHDLIPFYKGIWKSKGKVFIHFL